MKMLCAFMIARVNAHSMYCDPARVLMGACRNKLLMRTMQIGQDKLNIFRY